MSQAVSAIYRARWVLPVTAPPIRDGAVLVGVDGRIAAVGPAQSIDASDIPVIELGEAILIPGLINVHGHAELSVFRGALEDLEFPDWILRLVGTKRAILSDDDHLAAARWTAVEAIRAGITTFAGTEASDAGVRALQEAGMRGVIFQEYGVFPWLTVEQNIDFGLKLRANRVPSPERAQIRERYMRLMGLADFAAAYPKTLSGGMRQRLALARAYAVKPQFLLMDEPFGALDAQTRAVLQEELLRLWEETHKTVLYVTHSIEEAVLLGDRVILMTAHPGTNKSEFVVDLPRPRDISTTATPEFAALTGAIWDDLRDEVRQAMEAQR